MNFNPITQDLGDGYHKLVIPKEIIVISGPKPYIIEVPAGFVTDYASIPKYLRWYINSDDPKIMGPAFIHDFLYQTNITSRATADAIFYHLLRENNVKRWEAKFMRLGVSLFGKKSYLNGPQRLTKNSPELIHFIAERPSYE